MSESRYLIPTRALGISVMLGGGAGTFAAIISGATAPAFSPLVLPVAVTFAVGGAVLGGLWGYSDTPPVTRNKIYLNKISVMSILGASIGLTVAGKVIVDKQVEAANLKVSTIYDSACDIHAKPVCAPFYGEDCKNVDTLNNAVAETCYSVGEKLVKTVGAGIVSGGTALFGLFGACAGRGVADRQVPILPINAPRPG